MNFLLKTYKTLIEKLNSTPVLSQVEFTFTNSRKQADLKYRQKQ